jgi:CBS domain-containing protein
VKDHLTPLSDANRVTPETALSEALKKLGRAPGGRLLVMENGRLVGLLTKEGLVRFVQIRQVLEESGDGPQAQERTSAPA